MKCHTATICNLPVNSACKFPHYETGPRSAYLIQLSLYTHVSVTSVKYCHVVEKAGISHTQSVFGTSSVMHRVQFKGAHFNPDPHPFLNLTIQFQCLNLSSKQR